MELQIIGRAAVRKLLDMPACIGLMRKAMLETSAGRTLQPPRYIMPLDFMPGAGLGLMPGMMQDPGVSGAKVTAVYPGNADHGLQSHQGVILVFDGARGTPLAAVHGGEVTAIRTAAASALATDALARADAGDLAILGTGEQAAEHLRAMAAVRTLRRVRVWGRNPARAAEFAAAHASDSPVAIEVCATVPEATRGADLICTTTAADDPILALADVTPGAHVNVVGSSVAAFAEISNDLVQAARFFCDKRSSALLQAGEFLRAKAAGLVTDDHILAEAGEVLAGTAPGRLTADDLTIYKSLGMAAEDLVCAEWLCHQSRAQGLGTAVDF